MKCPQCDSEFPLTWKRHFKSPFGIFDCPSCSTKLQGTHRWFYWPLTFLGYCIFGVPLAILGSKYGSAGALSGWIIGALSIGIPFDRFLDSKFMVLKSLPEGNREFYGTTREAIMSLAGYVLGTVGALLMKKHLAFSLLSLIGIILLLFGVRSVLRKNLAIPCHKATIALHVLLLVLTILGNSVALTFEVIERKSVMAREQKRLKCIENGQISVIKYPGWCGFADVGETELAIVSFADESPITTLLNSNSTMNVSLASVIAVNRSTNETILLDSTKAVLTLTDGQSLHCLPPAKVLGSYTNSTEKMISAFLGPHSLRAKSDISVFIHVPFGFSWNDVTSVTIHVDNKPVIIQGRVFNAVDKAEFLEARKKARGNTVLSKE